MRGKVDQYSFIQACVVIIKEQPQDGCHANEKTGKICCDRHQHDTVPSQWALVFISATYTSGQRSSILAQPHYEEADTNSPALSGAILAKVWPMFGTRREAGGIVKQPPTSAVVGAFW